MVDDLTTFVVPTIGRATLERAVESALATQARVLVVLDGPREVKLKRHRNLEILAPPRPVRAAGLARNRGIRVVKTPWVSFLDDDDVVTADYAEHLREEAEQDVDVVMFRMADPLLGIVPSTPEIAYTNVGISFSARTRWMRRCPFGRARPQDFNVLLRLERAGATIRFSDHVTYKVRPGESKQSIREFRARIRREIDDARL